MRYSSAVRRRSRGKTPGSYRPAKWRDRRSPGIPGGGEVIWRRSPVSTRTAQTATGPRDSGATLTARVRPSGVQLGAVIAVALVKTVRFGPPKGEIRFSE